MCIKWKKMRSNYYCLKIIWLCDWKNQNQLKNYYNQENSLKYKINTAFITHNSQLVIRYNETPITVN